MLAAALAVIVLFAPSASFALRLTTAQTLRTVNYGNYGIFLSMGNAGIISSTVGLGQAVNNG